jgi:hypothetical protein
MTTGREGRIPVCIMCNRTPHHARESSFVRFLDLEFTKACPLWLMVQYSRHLRRDCAGFPPPDPLTNLHAEVEHDDGVTGIYDQGHPGSRSRTRGALSGDKARAGLVE